MHTANICPIYVILSPTYYNYTVHSKNSRCEYKVSWITKGLLQREFTLHYIALVLKWFDFQHDSHLHIIPSDIVVPRKLKGESGLHAILPSHIEGIFCTSRLFRCLVWQTIILSAYIVFFFCMHLYHMLHSSQTETWFSGKSILQVPDTGMSQYWSILEYFWCTSIAQKCDPYVL